MALTKTVTLSLDQIAVCRASLNARLFELENSRTFCLNDQGRQFIENEIRITKDAIATLEIGQFDD